MKNLAILGFGIVGTGVYEVVTKSVPGLKVKRVLDVREFPGHPVQGLLTKNFDDILNDDEIDIVAESIGGVNPVYEYTKALLMRGKSVVTSNKAVVAEHGHELMEIAKKHNVKYLFEASVCGAIPIIRPVNTCMLANPVTEIMGILNGTTNYILTKMLKNNISFQDALKMAQDEGYAEKDPTEDVEGFDTRRKITILSWLAFGEKGKKVNWKDVPGTGITQVTLKDLQDAEAANCSLKLIGHAKLVGDKVECKVEPMRIPKDNPLAGVDDVFNAVLVRGEYSGDLMFYGRGAGKLPTASAMVNDIICAM